MNLSEVAKKGIRRITRDGWGWNSFVEIYITDDNHFGPWCYVVTMPLEPISTPLWEHPTDGWKRWSVPEESQSYYENECKAYHDLLF